MTKKSSGFKKVFQNKRGFIIGAALAVVTISLVAALGVASMLLYKVANTDYGYGAYLAADTCLHQFDSLQPDGVNMGAGCVAGKAIDFTNSTASSIVCDNPGTANTLVSLGSNCSCLAQITSVNGNSTYDIVTTGRCDLSGTRTTADNGYSVSISQTINGCQTCSQLCPTPGGTGNPCVTNCSVACNSCCGLGVPPTCNAGTGVCN